MLIDRARLPEGGLHDSHYQPRGLNVETWTTPPNSPLARFIDWSTKTTDAEPIFHLGAAVALFSHLCVRAGVRIDAQQRLVPATWSFLVGVPAAAKSTAVRRAVGVLRDVLEVPDESHHHPRVDPLILAEGSVPGLLEALGEYYDPELELSHGLIFRDEAARLLEQRDSVADVLCGLIDGDTIKRHLRGVRKENRSAPGSVPDRVINPAFTGAFVTTFSRLREVTRSSFLEGGLFSRFLWFVGSGSLGPQRLRVDLHLDERAKVVQETRLWFHRLRTTLRLRNNQPLSVSDAAFLRISDTLFADLEREGRVDNRLNAARKRAITQAVLLGGIFAALRESPTVDIEDIEPAINLCRLSLDGLSKLDPSLGTDEAVHLAHRIMHLIRAFGDEGISKSEIYRRLKKPKHEIEPAIEYLQNCGYAAIEVIRTPGRSRIVLHAREPGNELH